MSESQKIALVTGASRGIGQAIAHRLAQSGATVFGTATSEAGAEKISENFKAAGLAGKGLCLNVTDAESIDSVLKQIKEDAGGAPQILVNNAGITRDNLLMRMKDEEWNDIMNTNLTSVFRLSKACLRGMMKAKWGRIVTIGSVVGTMGNPGQSNYCAAKAGLIGFSKSLAKEIGSRGVTVNVVAPGFIDTDMTKALSDEQRKVMLDQVPMVRLGSPEDIAGAVNFLASDDAGYITGETINVNGGMHMI
ncbi:3-oxoacyl-ACP reductase FabG [Kangiella sp. TOML190]|uniref:3-oxoacyl-ACP reductase FabG n=1 Tax=Kangiella sp. TOML190 TaxID=2931351 RepID=UPI00203B7481|nr:3-oxoacyl-ACP reductase FabG [Kangiella sp. TOML190]